MTQHTLYDYLSKNKLFANLDGYAFSVIESYLSFRKLEANEVLFAEGERGDYMAFVVAGKLEILKKNKHNQLISLKTISAGDSIGEMAIIDELSRSATVKAIEKSGLVILLKKDFDRILQDHPRIGIDILKGVAIMLSLNLRRTSRSLSEKRH